MNRYDSRGFAAILALLIVAVLLVGGGIWYYEVHKGISQNPSLLVPIQPTNNQQASSSMATTNPALASSLTPTSTWKTYTHVANKNLPYDMNISFQYPSDYIVTAPKTLTVTDSFPFFNITGPTSTGQYQPSMQLFAWSDPPTHVYENAINSGFAKYFTTSGGLTGVESNPGYILFDTGRKDSNGSKIILSIQSATPDVGTTALAEKIMKTLVFNQVSASSAQASQLSVNFTINGSRGPLLVGEGELLNAIWTSSGVSNCLLDGNSVLDASNQTLGAPPPGVPASSTTYTLACNAPDGSVVSKSIQVSWEPLGLSVAIDPNMPNPESISSNAQKVLLGSFDATASGPDGIILTTINIGASADVTSSLLSVGNVEILVSTVGTSTWFTPPPLVNRIESGPNAINFFYGSLAIPQDGTAHIQIYGNVVAATPGKYLSPFELANITAAGASTPNVYSASSKANLLGQNITVTQ